MEGNVLKRKELHVSDNNWGFQSYCITRRGETALAFESRVRNNYIQLTKDSLGSSPTQDLTWPDHRKGREIKWFEFCSCAALINTSTVPLLVKYTFYKGNKELISS